jgi:hypothetical protein
VVIGYLNVIGVTLEPTKTDAKLVIYPYRVLAFSIVIEGMKLIPWRCSKIF